MGLGKWASWRQLIELHGSFICLLEVSAGKLKQDQ